LDFWSKVGIERIGIKIKKTSNMGGMPEVSGKTQFRPLTLKITQIIWFWHLNFFQIQFWYKSSFLLFLNPWSREEIDRSPVSGGRERKILLTSIFVSNGSIWWWEFILGVFFLPLKFKIKQIQAQFDFSFWLILVFWCFF
jgi:hypothetical protein